MDISKWPMEKIMQLPRCVFGRSYIVSCSAYVTNNNTAWDMSEISFPPIGVIWQIMFFCHVASTWDGRFRVAIGSQVPTSIVMMDLNEEFIIGYGRQGTKPRRIFSYQYLGEEKYDVRQIIHAQGKKLILEVFAPTDKETRVRVGVVVTGIPKELPEWFNSGLARIL